MPPTAKEIFDKFNQNHSAKAVRSIDPATGVIGTSAIRTLHMAPGANRAADVYFTATFGGGGRAGDVTAAQARTLFQMVEALIFHGYDHLQAKNSVTWQHMYHYLQRQFTRRRANGHTGQITLWSYPCHYCGLHLPEDIIQVDHRQAQGSPSGYAVAKTFHSIQIPAFALTVGTATGAKNTQALAIINNTPVNRIPVKGWDRNQAWQERVPNAAKLDRYTLSNEGETFLAIAIMMWGLKNVEKACLNSILNVVPACPMCNLSKSAKVHAHK